MDFSGLVFIIFEKFFLFFLLMFFLSFIKIFYLLKFFLILLINFVVKRKREDFCDFGVESFFLDWFCYISEVSNFLNSFFNMLGNKNVCLKYFLNEYYFICKIGFIRYKFYKFFRCFFKFLEVWNKYIKFEIKI